MKENGGKLTQSEPKSSCLLALESLINLFLRAQHWLVTGFGRTHIICMAGAGMTSEQGPDLELTVGRH